MADFKILVQFHGTAYQNLEVATGRKNLNSLARESSFRREKKTITAVQTIYRLIWLGCLD